MVLVSMKETAERFLGTEVRLKIRRLEKNMSVYP